MSPDTRLPERASDDAADRDRPALLFDMDGVVLTGRESDPVVHERALDDALTDYGLTASERERTALSGYEYTEAFADACRALGVAPEPFYTVREVHSARRIAARIEAGVRGIASDADALTTLADDYELALVSNNYHRAVETVVDHHGLDVFAVARGREPGVTGFRRRKPDRTTCARRSTGSTPTRGCTSATARRTCSLRSERVSRACSSAASTTPGSARSPSRQPWSTRWPRSRPCSTRDTRADRGPSRTTATSAGRTGRSGADALTEPRRRRRRAARPGRPRRVRPSRRPASAPTRQRRRLRPRGSRRPSRS